MPRFASHSTVAVMTHGGPVGVVLRMLADGTLPVAPGAEPPRIAQVPNCAVLELVWQTTPSGATWAVACVNDVSHLSELATESDSG